MRIAGCSRVWVTMTGQKQAREKSFDPGILSLAFELHTTILKPCFYLTIRKESQEQNPSSLFHIVNPEGRLIVKVTECMNSKGVGLITLVYI